MALLFSIPFPLPFLSVVWLCCVLCYLTLLLLLWAEQGHALRRKAYSETAPESTAVPSLLLLVAARNEAQRLPALLSSLRAQTDRRLQVWVVDDHSEDATAEIVLQAAVDFPMPLRLLQLPPGMRGGKKRALQWAMEQLQADWVATTDADCTLPPQWVALLRAQMVQEGVHWVSGPLRYRVLGPWSAALAVEFSSLIGVAASSMRLGAPNMCNGANLAFSRQAFLAVGGYADNLHLASGDDEFLMHKISSRFPGSLRFLPAPGYVVETEAPVNFSEFWQQRLRWAGKWRHYRSLPPLLAALGVFGFHLCWLLALGCTLLGLWPWQLFAFALLGRAAAETLFLRRVLQQLGQGGLWPWAPLLSLGYSAYAVATALGSIRGRYRWKGRRYV